MKPSDVLEYWESIGSKGWWMKDAELDANIGDRFGQLHNQACAGELDNWAETPDGALALIIVLDQFSRNMFRGSPKTFAQDPKALALAKEAIAKGFDKQANETLRFFFYLPFEHSEKFEEQERSLELFEEFNGEPEFMKAAREHHDIIKQFARFPHRNEVLGREITLEEQAYLDGGGFKG
jgi:uncharacterized protein (DUF924 family)